MSEQKPFAVGDLVFSPLFGPGVVVEISDDPEFTHPVGVKFEKVVHYLTRKPVIIGFTVEGWQLAYPNYKNDIVHDKNAANDEAPRPTQTRANPGANTQT